MSDETSDETGSGWFTREQQRRLEVERDEDGGARVTGLTEREARLADRMLPYLTGAWYDKSQTATGGGQTPLEDVVQDSAGSPVGGRSFRLSEALDVKAGDVVNLRMVTNARGELVVSELEVVPRGH